jgi:uncharacterized protein (DUF1330 family)
MAKGYWIAHVTVSDPDQYKHYADAAPEAFAKYKARMPVAVSTPRWKAPARPATW